MDFSTEDEEKLINVVSRYPIIYDTSHAAAHNITAKNKVWKAIGKEIDKKGFECKKKWKFIRDGYQRYRKKHKIGDGRPFPKNAKHKRYELLTFLEGVPQPQLKSSSRIQPASPALESIEEVSVAYSWSTEQEGPKDDPSPASSDSNVDNTNEAGIRPEIIRKKISKKKLKQDLILKIWKQRDERRRILMESVMKNGDDDIDLFSRHIGAVLRNLPPVERAQAKKDLSSVISTYEIMAANNRFLEKKA